MTRVSHTWDNKCFIRPANNKPPSHDGLAVSELLFLSLYLSLNLSRRVPIIHPPGCGVGSRLRGTLQTQFRIVRQACNTTTPPLNKQTKHFNLLQFDKIFFLHLRRKTNTNHPFSRTCIENGLSTRTTQHLLLLLHFCSSQYILVYIRSMVGFYGVERSPCFRSPAPSQ